MSTEAENVLADITATVESTVHKIPDGELSRDALTRLLISATIRGFEMGSLRTMCEFNEQFALKKGNEL